MSYKNKKWVFVELKTTLLRDTSDYFYFGQISEEIINQIDNNQNTTGLFILSNIRFWNNDDLLEIYEDEELGGFKIFRVSDIHHLRTYKKDPVLIYDMDELHESSKNIRSKYMCYSLYLTHILMFYRIKSEVFQFLH